MSCYRSLGLHDYIAAGGIALPSARAAATLPGPGCPVSAATAATLPTLRLTSVDQGTAAALSMRLASLSDDGDD